MNSFEREAPIANKLTAPAILRIEQAWRAGANIHDIAAEYGVSPQAIDYHVGHIQRDNGPKRGPKRRFCYETAARLYLKHNMTQDEIAYRLGVSRMSVLRAVKEARHAA